MCNPLKMFKIHIITHPKLPAIDLNRSGLTLCSDEINHEYPSFTWIRKQINRKHTEGLLLCWRSCWFSMMYAYGCYWCTHWVAKWIEQHQPHPRNYPHTPTDHRHADKPFRLVMTLLCSKLAVLLFAALGKAEPLISTAARQKFDPDLLPWPMTLT